MIPSVPCKIKEFAYFGFGITLLSAGIAHFARGDARLSVFFIIDPLFLVLLIVSYVYFEKSHSFSAWQTPQGKQFEARAELRSTYPCTSASRISR